MATDMEQLTAIRSLALQRIAEITATPKPNYSIDGQQVAWADYLRQLQATVDWCNERLADLGPFEIRTRGVSE